MRPFKERLEYCQRAGNMTIADLARWFDRPHATVRSWILQGVEPGGGPIDIEHARQLLGLLEMLIRKERGFPVPRLSPQKRIAYVKELRHKVLPDR